MLKNSEIIEIIETGPVFSQVRDTWCCIFKIKNAKPIKESQIRHKKISRFIVSTEERLELFHKQQWSFFDKINQSVWIAKRSFVIGYLQSLKQQMILDKIEKNPSLGEIPSFCISRGEEGSKLKIKETINGKFEMIIPENVDRYSVSVGAKIDVKTLTPNKVKNIYVKPKIWIIRIQKMRWLRRLIAGFDSSLSTAAMKTLQSITSTSTDLNQLLFLQALLCSNLINYWCINYLADDLNQSYLSKIPIKHIAFESKPEKQAHDKIVGYASKLLELNKSAEPDLKQIQHYENQIDKLVYELYGLSEDEIKIIEEATSGNS
jgi:hypothetical protein